MRFHLLFAPGKPWKRKSAAYLRMHAAALNELVQDSGSNPVRPHANGEHKGLDSAPTSKRGSHIAASKQFRQTGEVHG
jgi:hypothetical protein